MFLVFHHFFCSVSGFILMSNTSFPLVKIHIHLLRSAFVCNGNALLCTYTRVNCLCRRHRSARHGFDLNTRPEWTREILNKTYIKTLILLYKEIYLLEVEVGSMGYLEWFDLHLKNVLTHKFWWKRDITLVSFQSLFLLFPTIVIGCPSPVLNYPRLSWYSLFCYPVFASAYPSVYFLQIQMQI